MAKKKHGKKNNIVGDSVVKYFKRNSKIIHNASQKLNKKSTKEEFALIYFASRGLCKDVITYAERSMFDARECSEIINDLQKTRKHIIGKAEKYDIRL